MFFFLKYSRTSTRIHRLPMIRDRVTGTAVSEEILRLSSPQTEAPGFPEPEERDSPSSMSWGFQGASEKDVEPHQ